MTRKKIDVFGLVLTSLVAIVATVILILDFAWSTLCGVLFVYVLVFLSWFLIRRSKPVDHTRHDGHHVMLWDAATYTCIHGVKPHKVTLECAWPIGHDLKLWPDPPQAVDRLTKVYYPRP